MRTFAEYFIEKELSSDLDILHESAQAAGDFNLRSFTKSTSALKSQYVSSFEIKYPNAQIKDIEEAFDESLEKTSKSKPESASAFKRSLKKHMDSTLSKHKTKRNEAKKNLSCISAIKSVSAVGEYENKPIAELMKKALGTLTSKEKRVMELCSQGKSVRGIGSEMGVSFPTAWRILNSAVDKIRVFHGIRPRHKDIRRKK